MFSLGTTTTTNATSGEPFSSVPEAPNRTSTGSNSGGVGPGSHYSSPHPSSSVGPNPYTIDAVDNAQAYDREVYPHRHNWKANTPMPGHFTYADFREHLQQQRGERGGNREKTSGRVREKRGLTKDEEEEEEWGRRPFSMYSFASPNLQDPGSNTDNTSNHTSTSSRLGAAQGTRTSHHGTVSAGKHSWRGGGEEMSGGGEGPQLGGAASGVFRRGRPRTITELCTNLLNAAFEPRASDSKAFGGDGATERAERKEELKHLDPRISPIFHEELMEDALRCVQAIRAPSGAIIPNGREALLKGRIVGLLFFSESERCMAFMRYLRAFHAEHHPDFLVVGVSLAGSYEMLDLTRGFGFYHLTHRDGGASWVMRDVGLEMKLFVPLPRLIIVDGTTGKQISRRGVTEVWTHADKCMSWWKTRESDCSMLDFMRTWYLSDD